MDQTPNLPKSLATGILWQDLQHQQLIETLKQVEIAFNSYSEEEMIPKAMTFLEHYTKDHFGMEEAYMKAYGYPDLENHLALHEHFKDKLDEFKNYQNFSVKISPDSLCEYLVDWITKHIQLEDTKISIFLKSVGVK